MISVFRPGRHNVKTHYVYKCRNSHKLAGTAWVCTLISYQMRKKESPIYHKHLRE